MIILIHFSEKSPHIPYFFALKRCTYSGLIWWFGLFGPKSSSRPWNFFVSQCDEVTLPSGNSVTLPIQGDGFTRFLRFSKPNFIRKTMCETIKIIILLSVYFLVFHESKKYFKGTLFSLKMQYLNKQGQQAICSTLTKL